MTMITEATPMTTPMSVRMERSLLAQRDWSASLKASVNCIVQFSLAGLALLRSRVDQYPFRLPVGVAPRSRPFECTQPAANGRAENLLRSSSSYAGVSLRQFPAGKKPGPPETMTCCRGSRPKGHPAGAEGHMRLRLAPVFLLT